MGCWRTEVRRVAESDATEQECRQTWGVPGAQVWMEFGPPRWWSLGVLREGARCRWPAWE